MNMNMNSWVPRGVAMQRVSDVMSLFCLFCVYFCRNAFFVVVCIKELANNLDQ